MRPGRADVIEPNALLELPSAVWSLTLMSIAAEPGPTPGAPGSTPYWTWLNVLKLSSRSCKFSRSYSCRFFISPISKLLIPGWRRRLRPLLPNCPASGCEKAEVLKYFVTLFDPCGSPLTFARCVNVLSRPDLSFASTENGKPFWKVPMPVIDHPLTAA